MTKTDAIIALHGYSQSIPQGQRNWEEVAGDRLNAAYEIARFFNRHGIETELMISGGTVKDGIVEADAIYDFAKARTPDLFDVVANVVKEKDSKNTMENVEKTLAYAEKAGAEILCPTSSKDHISRVARDWAYNKKAKHPRLVFITSDEPYSLRGYETQPFIVEPPFWGIDALQKIMKVPPNKRENVAKVIQTAIEETLKV